MQYAKEIFDKVVSQLTINGHDERKATAFWLLEHRLSLRRLDILLNKEVKHDTTDWDSIIARLNTQEPIQYVLGETTFYGRRFMVTPAVLIPRPETEELVQLVLPQLSKLTHPRLLDIGTGSGCLAISLAAEHPAVKVTALDISPEALVIATQNAELNKVKVNFLMHDILQEGGDLQVDIIVSNPPYVLEKEATHMHANVLQHEPHVALFVPNNKPLLFYEAIGKYASRNLTENGFLYLEINESLGLETKKCVEGCGFGEVVVIKDINGKDRFIVASQPRAKK